MVALTVRTPHSGVGRTHGHMMGRTQAESGATSAPVRPRGAHPHHSQEQMCGHARRGRQGSCLNTCVQTVRHSEPLALRRAGVSPADGFPAEFPDPWARPAGGFLEGQPSALVTLLPGYISHSEKGIFFLFQQWLDFISLSKLLSTYCSIFARVLPVFIFSQSLPLTFVLTYYILGPDPPLHLLNRGNCCKIDLSWPFRILT